LGPIRKLTRGVLGMVLGLLAAAFVACLSMVGPPVVRLSASGPRVVAAVRAGYPELCNEWRDQLEARPSPASWYTSWDVDCISGAAATQDTLMTVNVVTCQWHEPLVLSTDWRRLLAVVTLASQPLRRCP
jgi:hypothetical protein